jgi:arsenite methyltransferase
MSMGARMFNRRASSDRSMPDEVVRSLDIGEGDWIADIGSGGGYFTLRFSSLVGEDGRVFAVDTNAKLLRSVEEMVEAEGRGNVVTVLTEGFPSDLPLGRIDLVFMRNVYHHIDEGVGYMGRLREHLSRDGRVAILDYTDSASGFSFHRMFGHHVPPARIREDMGRAGYSLVEEHDFLPEQSFMVFSMS